MRKLYFVKAEYAGQCVFGGHWLAANNTEAKELARAEYLRGQETAKAYGLPVSPNVASVTFIAKTSKANAAAMAANV